MLIQEDIDLIKREGMKKELYSQILEYLEQARQAIERAGGRNIEFEKEICTAEEALKTTKQLYIEWVKVHESVRQ